MHPKVVGELACGSLSNRGNRLRQWRDLPPLKSVSDDEAVQFLERHLLMSRGIGFIDVHLLAAVAQARGARLWSHDKRLAGIATELGFAFQPHDA